MLCCICFNFYGQIPAFPTAEGYGKYATGGRGGKVAFVTNLDDYISYNNLETPIPGSFRWALTQYPGEPLTIIFRVSGTIVLKPYLQLSGTSIRNQNDIRSSRAKLTIAGQTAPGEGIQIRNGKVNLGSSTDLIVRNIRFRIAETATATPIYGYKVGGVARDTLAPAGSFLPGAGLGIENATRVILDHCVFGWSGEENITMYDNRFTTVQWSIMHEGLYNDGHGKGNRGYGGQCGGISATWHHNFFAHNQSRSPRLNGARTDNETKVFIEFINNVVYNWGSSMAPYGGDVSTGGRSHTSNFVGNYFKPGKATSATKYFFTNYIVNGATYPKWHLAGNYMDGVPSYNTDNWNGFTISWSGTPGTMLPTKNQLSSDTLLYPPTDITFGGVWIGYEKYRINIENSQTAYQSIINKVGTITRDSVERRLINDLKNGEANYKASLGTWGIIDKSYNAEGFLTYPAATYPSDNDNDGISDAWELANGLNPNNAEDRNLTTAEGYTALEVYLAYLMGESIQHNFATSVKTTNSFEAKIFPTISKNSIQVQTDKMLDKAIIYDVTGKNVLIENLTNSNTINIEKLESGNYFLGIYDKNGKYAQCKFVRQ